HSFHRRHPVFDRAVNDGDEGVDFFCRVDDFNDDGQIGRQLQDLCRAHAAARAEAFHAAQHRRPGQSMFPRLPNNPLVQQHASVTIALADKDSEQRAFTWKRHDQPPMECARTLPTQTETRPSTNCKPILTSAATVWVSRANEKVSRAKDENVVKPPRMPTKINSRTSEVNAAALASASPAKKPINRQPTAFTASVPYGNHGL